MKGRSPVRYAAKAVIWWVLLTGLVTRYVYQEHGELAVWAILTAGWIALNVYPPRWFR